MVHPYILHQLLPSGLPPDWCPLDIFFWFMLREKLSTQAEGAGWTKIPDPVTVSRFQHRFSRKFRRTFSTAGRGRLQLSMTLFTKQSPRTPVASWVFVIFIRTEQWYRMVNYFMRTEILSDFTPGHLNFYKFHNCLFPMAVGHFSKLLTDFERNAQHFQS